MSTMAAIGVAAALLEHRNLLALLGVNQFAVDGEASQILCHLQRLTVMAHQHVLERDGRASIAFELFDRDRVVFGDPILLPAGSDDRKHGLFSKNKRARSARPQA